MLFNYLFIFMVGSIGGYFLELFYRKIIEDKWIKPGVFNGIYLPLYGKGLCICYFAYNLDINIIFKLFVAVILLTFIEFMCGLIFIKYFKIPLWDYSSNFLNYKGLICLKFSFYWGILSFAFIKIIFPLFEYILISNLLINIIIWIFLIILVIDVLITFRKLIKNKC